jgi:acyl-CoA synthetase (AMP-forming)/AMP-acid ligase II
MVTAPSAARSDATVHDGSGRVACGAPMGDTRLAIVDPQTRRRVPDQQVGEIWVSGGSCAQGYWNDLNTTQAVFKARLDDAEAPSDRRDWLRTGDLGFVRDGSLFITGRLRDLIILAGRNLFPADLEESVEAAHPAIASSGVAAFSVDVEYTERLVIAAELRRELCKGPSAKDSVDLDPREIRRTITAAIVADHGVAPYDIVLLRAGALPRTTSGKLQRGTAREQYLNQSLAPFTFSTHRLSNVACTD